MIDCSPFTSCELLKAQTALPVVHVWHFSSLIYLEVGEDMYAHYWSKIPSPCADEGWADRLYRRSFSFISFLRRGKGRWREGNWVIFHRQFAELTVLLTEVWMRDITDPRFDSWRTKLAQTKIQEWTWPFCKNSGTILPFVNEGEKCELHMHRPPNAMRSNYPGCNWIA